MPWRKFLIRTLPILGTNGANVNKSAASRTPDGKNQVALRALRHGSTRQMFSLRRSNQCGRALARALGGKAKARQHLGPVHGG